MNGNESSSRTCFAIKAGAALLLLVISSTCGSPTRSPVGALSLPYSVGSNGPVFHSSFMVWF